MLHALLIFPDVPFLIGAAVVQPFLLKALHITANVLVDRLNLFQYQFPQHILADIMRRAIATPTLIFGAAYPQMSC